MTAAEDQRYMRRALELAEQAGAASEVPVGAVVVLGGEVVGEGRNRQIGDRDPTAHAEVVALRAAAENVGNYRLPGATLYVTVEPCTMCAGAVIHARIAQLVFAAREPKAGAVVSADQLLDRELLNHHVAWREGVLASESTGLVQAFFAERRARRRAIRNRGSAPAAAPGQGRTDEQG